MTNIYTKDKIIYLQEPNKMSTDIRWESHETYQQGKTWLGGGPELGVNDGWSVCGIQCRPP